MVVQAALRRQARAGEAEDQQGGEGAGEAGQGREGQRRQADRGEQERQRAAARDPPRGAPTAVEAALQGGDQPADPGDRVAGRPVERVRIAEAASIPRARARTASVRGGWTIRCGAFPRGSRAAIAHGGDLGGLREAFPDAPEPWLDLSTGINPVPYPVPPVEASAWTRLPEAAEVRALREAAAAAYGAAGPTTSCPPPAPRS